MRVAPYRRNIVGRALILLSISISGSVASALASRFSDHPRECPAPGDLGIRHDPVDIARDSLAVIAPRSTGSGVPHANSERTPPFETGRKSLPHQRKLRQMAPTTPLMGPAIRPAIRIDQVALGESHIREIAAKLGLDQGQIEGWPTRNHRGVDSWTWARYRETSDAPWRWLNLSRPAIAGSSLDDDIDERAPFLPRLRDVAGNSTDYDEVFRDFLDFRFLTMKPAFGDIIWTDSSHRVVSSWLSPDLRPVYEQCAPENARSLGVELPQPARFNDVPVTFVATFNRDAITWSPDIEIVPAIPSVIDPQPAEVQVREWLPDFDDLYREMVGIVSGAAVAKFPISGTEMRFTRKNNAQIDHHLEYLNDYLQEYYKELGIETRRLPFEWRRMTHSNLVAVIPGEMQGRDPNPVIMMDHIDTAFARDVFYSTGVRVSVPGADDNATAVGALVLAAGQLRGRDFKHDIWLVHVTGEEFPADDLGARHFIQTLDMNRVQPSAIVLLDMIGYSKTSVTEFQVNPGDSRDSLALARLAMGAAADVAPDLRPLYRPYGTPESYLYNTDGIVFADYGLPVILINEVVNRTNYHLRDGDYHQMADNMDNVDFTYAGKIARIAIETAARAATDRN